MRIYGGDKRRFVPQQVGTIWQIWDSKEKGWVINKYGIVEQWFGEKYARKEAQELERKLKKGDK